MNNEDLIQSITDAEAAINAALVHFSKGIQQMQNAQGTYLHAIFDITENEPEVPAPTPAAPKQTLSTVPFDDLTANAVVIPYTARTQNSVVAFMDFHPKHRRWLDLLITDLKTIGGKSSADCAIMETTAKARRENMKSQTWHEFIYELHADKAQTGNDFTESQMYRLGQLIQLLSTGKTLQGCNTLRFRERNSGKNF